MQDLDHEKLMPPVLHLHSLPDVETSLFFVQARAITQQARSPVIRVYAASPDQAISDSTADSNAGSVTSEGPNGTSNGTGHSSPQSAAEDNR